MKSSTNTPNFLGLRTAIYHAPDLAQAKSWYSKILGIEPYFDQPFYVGFNVNGYEPVSTPIRPRPHAPGGRRLLGSLRCGCSVETSPIARCN